MKKLIFVLFFLLVGFLTPAQSNNIITFDWWENSYNSTTCDCNGYLDVTEYTGTPDNANYTKDVTEGIRDAIAAIIAMEPAYRKGLYFPPGFYYITETIDFSQLDGWIIKGNYGKSIIAIPTGVSIAGPMFNFNFNSSTIRRNNTISGLYFYSEASLGRAETAIDLSFNNRFALYEIRTSRITNKQDVAINFAYEGVISRCNFSGSKTISIPNNGVSMADEANAIVIIGSSFDNYYGNGLTPSDPDYIAGFGIGFESSKGLNVIDATVQKCDYGIQIASGSKGATISGGGYWEGNIIADIRLGAGLTGSLYSIKIEGNAIKSGSVGTTAGLLIDKTNIFGLTVQDVYFDNDDPIQFIPRANQQLQDIYFKNVRTGDTIYSFRNLISVGTQTYMDNIVVENGGTQMNGAEVPTFTPIFTDKFTEYVLDFDQWTNSVGAPITFLDSVGTFQKATAWNKNNASVETMVYTLTDVSGLTNQVFTFSCWVKFSGSINANDVMFMTNQSNTVINSSRPLRPGTLPTTDWVKMHIYGLLGSSDTELKIKILTRDENIQFAKPSLKLGFVQTQ